MNYYRLFLLSLTLSANATFTNAFAADRSPELSYSGYGTAPELKMAIYSIWIAQFGLVGCGFEQWSWIETPTYITGVPETSPICGGSHGYNYYYITKVCATGYVADSPSSPTSCSLPDGVVDLTKEKGAPDDQSCSKQAGNPINIAVGNKYQEEFDYVGTGAAPLTFSRIYNGQDGLWRHNFSAKLRIASDNIILVGADGRESYFSLSNGIATAELDELGKLIRKNGLWVYTSSKQTTSTFDDSGRLLRLEKASGEYYTLTYEADLSVRVTNNFGSFLKLSINTTAQGQPSKLITGDVQINYVYDLQKRLIKRSVIRNGITESRTYIYDDSRNLKWLTGIIDERGVRYASWIYDNQGRAISSSHANGAELTTISYNTDGSSTVTNALGKQTTYQFQVIQGVKRITAIHGEPSLGCPMSNTTLTYDEHGLIKTKIDNKGIITVYDYDGRGLEISRTEAAGTPQAKTTTTTWHTELFLPLTITEPGRTTTYTYDNRGWLLSQTSVGTNAPAERTWTYTYTAQGLPETTDGPRTDVSDITHYTYDTKGRLTSVTNALGHRTTLSNFDTSGHPQTLLDANNISSTLTYAPQGWLASISTAGSTTRFDYSTVGDITHTTRGDGSTLTYTWDNARRLTAVTNNLGEKIEYSLDAMGNRTAQYLKDTNGSLTKQNTWVYDELGRLLKSIGAGNQTRQQTYDLNGNPVLTIDPLSNINNQAYDPLNRLIQNTDPLNGITQFDHDAQGNLTQVKDPRGVTTRYQYDGLGNLSQLISPDSGTSIYLYDAAGNITQQTDARGVVTLYQYDALNRLTNKIFPANPTLNTIYAYDMTTSGNIGIGRLTALQDAGGLIGYKYDARGNLGEQLRFLTVAGTEQDESLKYTYDNANQLASISYPEGFSISYSRNNAGQITGINLTIGTQPPTVLVSNISYLPFGPLKNLTWGNGIQLNRQYDQDYQLTTQTIDTWQSTLSYDTNGNIKTRNHSLFGNQNYSYDALGHLTEEKSTVLRKTYSYDATSNRKQRSTYGTVNGIEQQTATQTLTTAADSNRMLQNDSWTMTLSDAAGNTLRQSQNLVYAYNGQGRLSEVRNPTNLYANYSYNALGQRILKRIFSANNAVTPTATYSYLYGADGQLLGQKTYSSTGKPSKAQYWVWLGGQPIAGIELEYTGKGTVNKTSQYYLHSDHLNTPRMATNQSKALLWSWNSDAFGAGGVNGDTHGNKPSLDMPLRFPGQLYDAHTAMNHNYFRDYDPNTGRYIQSDPIGLQGGINTYAYVGGNPINRTDPMGLYWYRQLWQTDFVVGRDAENSLVVPGDPVSRFIEDYVPAGRTFGEIHDSFVDIATRAGIPDWLANIPSMMPMYRLANKIETLRTLGILKQPTPPTKLTQCK
ncbi:MAG: RHS repeat-associated core domain-containing protein [Candidatus Nitrotoga sp. CP45]|nr:MAG: RHS repeat-associated core domain-containing protein [Candidatus Nitrotoga sp. CP45]